MEKIVKVWDKKYLVTIDRKYKTVWVASGDYEGADITVQDSSPGSALKRWREAATYKGNLG